MTTETDKTPQEKQPEPTPVKTGKEVPATLPVTIEEKKERRRRTRDQWVW